MASRRSRLRHLACLTLALALGTLPAPRLLAQTTPPDGLPELTPSGPPDTIPDLPVFPGEDDTPGSGDTGGSTPTPTDPGSGTPSDPPDGDPGTPPDGDPDIDDAFVLPEFTAAFTTLLSGHPLPFSSPRFAANNTLYAKRKTGFIAVRMRPDASSPAHERITAAAGPSTNILAAGVAGDFLVFRVSDYFKRPRSFLDDRVYSALSADASVLEVSRVFENKLGRRIMSTGVWVRFNDAIPTGERLAALTGLSDTPTLLSGTEGMQFLRVNARDTSELLRVTSRLARSGTTLQVYPHQIQVQQ